MNDAHQPTDPNEALPEEAAAEELPVVMCPEHDLPIKPGESCPACRRELHVNRSWDD